MWVCSERIYIKGVRVLNSDAFESIESNSINIYYCLTFSCVVRAVRFCQFDNIKRAELSVGTFKVFKLKFKVTLRVL